MRTRAIRRSAGGIASARRALPPRTREPPRSRRAASSWPGAPGGCAVPSAPGRRRAGSRGRERPPCTRRSGARSGPAAPRRLRHVRNTAAQARCSKDYPFDILTFWKSRTILGGISDPNVSHGEPQYLFKVNFKRSVNQKDSLLST